jgi:amino acid transporter
MKEQNKQLNLNLIFLIVMISSGIGFTVDVLTGYNNYTFLISFGLPLLFLLFFRKYIFVSTEKKRQLWKVNRYLKKSEFGYTNCGLT